MYVVALDRSLLPIFMLAWMGGAGLMRWHLREL
jgi:hypothetical protein